MNKRRTTETTIEPFGAQGDGEITMPLTEAISKLTAALSEIPDADRHTAVFRIWSGGMDVSIYPEVNYHRSETDAEMQERIAAEAYQVEREIRLQTERAVREAQQKEVQDRLDYERLKLKFEGKSA